MTTINGYLLTQAEEKACMELIKKMREPKNFNIDFEGYFEVQTKNYKGAVSIFWNWVHDIEELTSKKWDGMISCCPQFQLTRAEEK